MIHQLVAISALTTFIGAATTLPANAAGSPAAAGREGDHHGNGRHNRSIVSAASPTHNRGYQHTNNGNAGGTNSVQNGLCRHATVCDISQKVNIVQPERPAPPTPARPPAVVPTPPSRPAVAPPPALPAAAPNPPVKVPPKTVVPNNRTVRREAPRTPLMSMGPDRFRLMAPDSSAGFGISNGTGPVRLGLSAKPGPRRASGHQPARAVARRPLAPMKTTYPRDL